MDYPPWVRVWVYLQSENDYPPSYPYLCHRYGFLWVRVQVQSKIPMGYPCSSLPEIRFCNVISPELLPNEAESSSRFKDFSQLEELDQTGLQHHYICSTIVGFASSLVLHLLFETNRFPH